MFSPGQIIYFVPFYFKNGNTSKNKYFIIIKVVDEKILIASLPTRSNKAPGLIDIKHGCLNHDDKCFNCYLFEKDRVICDNGFAFDMNTYIYGNEVEDYNIEVLSSIYAIEGVDYNVVGQLKKIEFDGLYKCLASSTSIKRKIRRFLK